MAVSTSPRKHLCKSSRAHPKTINHLMTFQKASRIQRKGAKEILRVGQKALAYRKDLLDKEQRDRLKHANEKLLGVMRAKPVLSAPLEESAARWRGR